MKEKKNPLLLGIIHGNGYALDDNCFRKLASEVLPGLTDHSLLVLEGGNTGVITSSHPRYQEFISRIHPLLPKELDGRTPAILMEDPRMVKDNPRESLRLFHQRKLIVLMLGKLLVSRQKFDSYDEIEEVINSSRIRYYLNGSLTPHQISLAREMHASFKAVDDWLLTTIESKELLANYDHVVVLFGLAHFYALMQQRKGLEFETYAKYVSSYSPTEVFREYLIYYKVVPDFFS